MIGSGVIRLFKDFYMNVITDLEKKKRFTNRRNVNIHKYFGIQLQDSKRAAWYDTTSYEYNIWEEYEWMHNFQI